MVEGGVRVVNLEEAGLAGCERRTRYVTSRGRNARALLPFSRRAYHPCFPQALFSRLFSFAPSFLAVSRRFSMPFPLRSFEKKERPVPRTGEVPQRELVVSLSLLDFSSSHPHPRTVPTPPTYEPASRRPGDLLSPFADLLLVRASSFFGLSSHFAGRRRHEGRRERLLMPPVCHLRR
jgi:hypothetical protein